MADADHQELRVESEPGNGYALSGKIMLSAIVILFAVVVFMAGLHLYARWYLVRLRRRQLEHRRGQRRVSRSHIVMYIDSRFSVGAVAANHGLDREVLSSLPVFLHSPKAEEEPPLECAVCLSEFEEKEIVRLLPKCSHFFHIECIDMWFRSHSTCPLCRSPVEQVFHGRPEPVANLPEPAEKENGPEPGSTSGSGPEGVDCNTATLGGRRKGLGLAGVRIEVPPSRAEFESELTQNSPAGRLLSLKRILSMGRRSPATTPSGGTSREASELDPESGLSAGRGGGENRGAAE